MKLNMGCGARKLPGFVNVDAAEACAPDQVVDLEAFPWPWPSDSAEEVHFIHSLEHMGGDPKVFLKIMSELYRIARDGCGVTIRVPHPRHDNFLGDPTHVRPITRQTLALFDYRLCTKGIEAGAANTPLAHYLGVDFEIVGTTTVLDEPYFSRYRAGELPPEELDVLLKTQSNIARELRFELRVRKPCGVGGLASTAAAAP